jgi:hypothetical protein
MKNLATEVESPESIADTWIGHGVALDLLKKIASHKETP